MYRLAPQFALRVFEASGRLMVQGSGQSAIAAEVAGTDRIAVPQVDAEMEFHRDAQGAVVGMTLRQNGQVLQGAKD